jgi:hypothetical protein
VISSAPFMKSCVPHLNSLYFDKYGSMWSYHVPVLLHCLRDYVKPDQKNMFLNGTRIEIGVFELANQEELPDDIFAGYKIKMIFIYKIKYLKELERLNIASADFIRFEEKSLEPVAITLDSIYFTDMNFEVIFDNKKELK